MRKFLAISLLCIYVFTQIGITGWYYCKPLAHNYFKKLQSISLYKEKDGDLISINITNDKFREILLDDNEVSIEGVLYDIESKIINGENVYLLLKKDGAETKWSAKYEYTSKLVQKQSHGNSSANISFSGIFIVFYKTTEHIMSFPSYAELSNDYIPYHKIIYSSPLLPYLSYPPETNLHSLYTS